jgi:hypothetical protein
MLHMLPAQLRCTPAADSRRDAVLAPSTLWMQTTMQQAHMCTINNVTSVAMCTVIAQADLTLLCVLLRRPVTPTLSL